MNPLVQISEVSVKVCFVGRPRQSLHPGGGIAFEREERHPQAVDADVVEECSEPLLVPLPCGFAVRAPALVPRAPVPVSGACFAGSHSPWPPPFAPPTPLRSGPLCSSASQLLWQSLTSRDRASSATAPRLPDADRRQLPNGRSRDLPVPIQGASAHARFFDHAGPFGPCDGASETCCLPRSKQRRHPGIGFRGSMAGLCPPLPTLRRRPRGRQRTARGRCRSLLLHRSGLAPPTPCRPPGALRVLHGQPRSPGLRTGTGPLTPALPTFFRPH